jgi:hypothetical protein
VVFGIEAPEGSVTVPVNAPVDDDWDHVEGTNPTNPIVNKVATISQTNQLGLMSCPLAVFLIAQTSYSEFRIQDLPQAYNRRNLMSRIVLIILEFRALQSGAESLGVANCRGNLELRRIYIASANPSGQANHSTGSQGARTELRVNLILLYGF